MPCFLPALLSRLSLCFAAVVGLGLHSVSGEVLYSTDFDNFPVGENNWHGTDDWVSTVTTGGIQAIDEEAIVGGGLGNTASIGFERPPSGFSTVFRSINFDPAESDTSKIELDVLMGIQDSTNEFRDSFFVSIYNMEGDLLAALRFSNEVETYGIWRSDGRRETDTGIDFIPGELHVIEASIDFEANEWSASIDGLPMFTAEELSAVNNRERTFGPLAFEWQLASRLTSQYGDNWMLVADVSVATPSDDLPVASSPFLVSDISMSDDGVALSWVADQGFTYQVEHSDDLAIWNSDLPDSKMTQLSSSGAMTFTDQTVDVSSRHYRVVRTVALTE